MSFKIYPPNYFSEEKDFQIAWQNAIRFCMKNGMVLPTEYGPKSKDICSTIIMTGKAINQIKRRNLHPKFPTSEKHLTEYVKQFMPEFNASIFEYTYYDRLTNYPIAKDSNGVVYSINQLENIKEELKNSRRLFAITWVPEIDLGSEEPPCLQSIQLRVLQEPDMDNYILSKGQVEVFLTWRSRDLFSAWMANLVAIVYMIYNEILEDNYEIIKITDFISMAHVYESDWQQAGKI